MKRPNPRLAVCLLLLAAAQSPAPRFEPVQPELLSAGGALVTAWADYDGNGDPDLFVGMNGAPNRLYRNDRGSWRKSRPRRESPAAAPPGRRPGAISTVMVILTCWWVSRRAPDRC